MILVVVQKYTIYNGVNTCIYYNSMQTFINLVLSSWVQKYYGIYGFNTARFPVAEFCDLYFNDGCFVQGSQ